MVAHAFISSSWEVEADRSPRVKGQPVLYSVPGHLGLCSNSLSQKSKGKLDMINVLSGE